MDKSKEFSAVYFRAKCDGEITPDTQSTPERQIHGRTAQFRINQYNFVICAFDGAASEETDEANPFKFHINILDDPKHKNLEQAWAIVVDVCAEQGIGLVKVLNMGAIDRDDARKREAEAKRLEEARARPPEPPKQLTPEQEAEQKEQEEKVAERRREQQILDVEQRRKKITVYCDRTDWRNATLKDARVNQMMTAIRIIQERLIRAELQPDVLPAFDGRIAIAGHASSYVSYSSQVPERSEPSSAYVSYRSQASEREEHYVPHSSAIPGWDPFAQNYRLPHPITSDLRGQNPFHKLKEKDQEILIGMMLEQLQRNYPDENERKAILNMPDRGPGRTPLHYAARSGLQQVYAALVKAGADENVEDKKKKTPKQLLAKRQLQDAKQAQKRVTHSVAAAAAAPSETRQAKYSEKKERHKDKDEKKKKHKKKEKKEKKEKREKDARAVQYETPASAPSFVPVFKTGSLGILKNENADAVIPAVKLVAALRSPVTSSSASTVPVSSLSAVPESEPISTLAVPRGTALPTARLPRTEVAEGQQSAPVAPRGVPPLTARPKAPSAHHGTAYPPGAVEKKAAALVPPVPKPPTATPKDPTQPTSPTPKSGGQV